MESEDKYCDICGGECDGVHSLPRSRNDEIERLMTVLLSIDKDILDEAWRRMNVKRNPVEES